RSRRGRARTRGPAPPAGCQHLRANARPLAASARRSCSIAFGLTASSRATSASQTRVRTGRTARQTGVPRAGPLHSGPGRRRAPHRAALLPDPPLRRQELLPYLRRHTSPRPPPRVHHGALQQPREGRRVPAPSSKGGIPVSTEGLVTHLNPEGLHRNPAYSQVVTVTGPVTTVYVGGQNAVTATGEIVGKGDLG